MPNPDIWKYAGKGAAKLRGRPQSPEHVRRRVASTQRAIEKQRRECPVCAEAFTPTRPAQKYCSGRCWNIVHRKKRNRKRAFACPPQLYRELAEKQGHKCAICGAPSGGNSRKDRLAVDHCHKENCVRGLLCHRCNTAIGLLQDDATIVRRAADYLAQPPAWVYVPQHDDEQSP